MPACLQFLLRNRCILWYTPAMLQHTACPPGSTHCAPNHTLDCLALPCLLPRSCRGEQPHLWHDDRCVLITDKFPKARQHWLVSGGPSLPVWFGGGACRLPAAPPCSVTSIGKFPFLRTAPALRSTLPPSLSASLPTCSPASLPPPLPPWQVVARERRLEGPLDLTAGDIPLLDHMLVSGCQGACDCADGWMEGPLDLTAGNAPLLKHTLVGPMGRTWCAGGSVNCCWAGRQVVEQAGGHEGMRVVGWFGVPAHLVGCPSYFSPLLLDGRGT